MLQLENITKKVGSFEIQEISCTISEGDYFVLVGPSGAGKTLLLELIAGILIPDKGRLLHTEKDITNIPIQERGMVLVYQDQALFPHLNVKKNILYGLSNQCKEKGVEKTLLCQWAQKMGVEHLLERKPSTLSGGEAQRVALCRALIRSPRCLLLDEPLASLDKGSASELRSILRSVHRMGVTVIHVTHDCEEALSLASVLGVMHAGKIIQFGTPEQILKHPQSSFVAEFIGLKNYFQGSIVSRNADAGGCALFETVQGVVFSLVTDSPSESGSIIIRSEDIFLSIESSKSSARNSFEGYITDLYPSKLGIEVTISFSIRIIALITNQSFKELELCIGRKVFIHIKATAIRFIAS